MLSFAGANFGYSIPVENSSSFGSYTSEATNCEPSTSTAQVSGSNLDATVAGPSIVEIEDWWLGPRSDGVVGYYTGSTLLDSSQAEFARGYGFQTGSILDTDTDDAQGFDVLRQQSTYLPECVGPSMTGPSAGQSSLPLTQLPLAMSTGPIFTPSPVPTLSRGSSPSPSASYTATKGNRANTYDQPLPGPNLGGQLLYLMSTSKGRTRATDHLPTIHPSSAGNTLWQHQLPYIPQNYDTGPNPQMGALLTGPRRSIRSANRKGKQKCIPMKTLPLGIDWPNTCDRFCAEMAKICFNQPTGEVTSPETAYARTRKFIGEDLYLSPLVVKPLGQRPSRDLEQYLTGVLNELRPWQSGYRRGVQHMLERVAQELENELVVVNDDFALLDGHSNEIDLEELDGSEETVKRRIAEQVRRGAIRGSLKRMTLFFKVPQPGFLWTRPHVLFFAITYLVFGARAFGERGEFFIPKLQL